MEASIPIQRKDTILNGNHHQMTRTDDHIPVARTSIKVRMPFAVRDYIHTQAAALNISAEHLIREAIINYLPDVPPHILYELESMRVHGNTKYHTREAALQARAQQAREKYRQNTMLVAAASRLAYGAPNGEAPL